MEAAVRERERRRVRNFMTKRLWPQNRQQNPSINMIPIHRQKRSFCCHRPQKPNKDLGVSPCDFFHSREEMRSMGPRDRRGFAAIIHFAASKSGDGRGGGGRE